MLVHYPVTQAPETGTTPVTTACVQNAHLTAGSSSLSVTCDPSGIWGGQSPQCECDEGFVEGTDQSGDQICRGIYIIVFPAVYSRLYSIQCIVMFYTVYYYTVHNVYYTVDMLEYTIYKLYYNVSLTIL